MLANNASADHVDIKYTYLAPHFITFCLALVNCK